MADIYSGTTRWGTLNTTSLLPASVASVPGILQTVVNTANLVVNAAATVADTLDQMQGVVANPRAVAIRAAVASAKAILNQVTFSSMGAGVHELMVPVQAVNGNPLSAVVPASWGVTAPVPSGSGGSMGFYKTVDKSLSDPFDPYRPVYGPNSYVAGLVLLAGSDAMSGLLPVIALLKSLKGHLAVGVDANLLPYPQNFRGQLIPYANAASTAVRLTWSTPPLGGKAQYGVGGFVIKGTRIYRSNEPILEDTPESRLSQLQIDYVAYDSLGRGYTDATVEPGKTYYYAIAFDLITIDTKGAREAVRSIPLSSWCRVQVKPPEKQALTMVSGTPSPPNWIGLSEGRQGIPPLAKVVTALTNLVGTIEMGVANTQTALGQTALAMRTVAAARTAQINRLIQVLNDVKSILAPNAGVYAYAFYGAGGTDFFRKSLYTALFASDDPNRPPFTTGNELVCGSVSLAGANSPASLAAIYTLYSLLATNGQGFTYGPPDPALPPVYFDSTGRPMANAPDAQPTFTLCDTAP